MAALQFNWDKCYELGIQEIDEQHKKLVDIYNKLAKAFLTQKTKDVLAEILSELNNYADYHFKSEEKLFSQYNLTGLENHIEEHNSYLIKMKQFENTSKQGVNIDFSLLSFLRKWWSEHIMGADKEYAKLIVTS